MKSILRLFLLSLALFFLPAANAEDRSFGELHQIMKELHQLTRTGGPEAAETIGAYLNDPKLETHARTALKNLPEKAGLPVLQKALGETDGACLAGVIMTLGDMRDTDSQGTIIVISMATQDADVFRAACLALGKIGTPEALKILRKYLTADDVNKKLAAADGMFLACREKPESAQPLYREVREANVSVATTMIATKNEYALTGEKSLLRNLLRTEDGTVLRTAKTMLTLRPTDEILAEVMRELADGNFPAKNRAAFIQALGSCGNRSVVPELIKMMDSPDVEVKLAVLNSLADLKSGGTTELFVSVLLSKSDEAEFSDELKAAAMRGILALEKEDLESLVDTLWRDHGNDARTLILSILSKNAERLSSQMDMIRAAMDSQDEGVRVKAYTTYALIQDARPDVVAEMLSRYERAGSDADMKGLKTALSMLCRRASEKQATVDVLLRYRDSLPENKKVLAVSLLGDLTGKDAVTALGKIAMRNDSDALTDEATKVLGQWPTTDADDVLYMLAAEHPSEKYRVRTLRGFLRLVRQMGYTPFQKIAMARAAEKIATRDEEKNLIRDILNPLLEAYPEKSLFDGSTFDGWEGDLNVFRIEDGTIIGGNMQEGLGHNEFLVTRESFGDFYFRADCKIVGHDGNAGIQFRSVRQENSREMIGYQADMTTVPDYWGNLYDESRRNRMLVVADRDLVAKIYKPGDFNHYEIVCKDRHIALYVNGYKTVDYTEPEDMPATGQFGLQIHSGPPAEASYKNIYIAK